MKKLLPLAVLSALLAACGSKTEEAAAPPAGAPEPAAATPTAPPTDAELAQQASATQETAGTDGTAVDASLARTVPMPENVQLPSGRWKAGTHYKPIVPAQSTGAEPGQVEVIEFMWLGCNHCSDLQPVIEAWAAQKQPYVNFRQEAAMWGPMYRAHARLLYTLQALNRPELVGKAFNEIHVRKNPLVSTRNDDAETLALQTAFAKANGISEADFKREYNGFGVNTRLQRAEELTRRYRIESVPTVVINGKYQSGVDLAGGRQQLTQLITDLAAFEKGR